MLLDVRDVTAGYGRLTVLRQVSLAVRSGTVAALIGSNGAGKTTLLRVISGLLAPAAGRIVFDGLDVTGWPPERLVGLGLAHVPERRQLFSSMSVEDNLRLGAYLRFRTEGAAAVAADLDRVFAIFPRLRERRRQLAGTLSGGEQQMLAIGRGLMARPRLLLLDEPSLGLAPLLVRELFAGLVDLRAAGHTLLLAEQNARQALQVADDAFVLENGRVSRAGPGAALLADPRVQAAYLGARASAERSG
ncbi:MAG: ABC transporter ATP-binding protein [Armatimonadota bacterium]|nr:ABC transporter ATP-binding protein [Armatimonadota bacterium]MDR7486006.1 ABC transporter ATP-binding protein [Armatimonadota bacterium]MDR7532577.1 ABC transporter ATP-binding protein [Armatimonadota bacterium]MDR7536214.1 ABC transporter ATP-binding protein [Armatimonadota bacterium]